MERAYSPKFNSYGYYMLGAFIKNLPVMLQRLVDENKDDVLVVECTGKKTSQASDHEYYTFKLVGKYSYNKVPEEYQDHRGQYPNPRRTSRMALVK